MEEVLLRFFHLGQQIFSQIDDQSFVNCRIIGRSWKTNIDAEDFAWTKITKKFPCESGKICLHIAAMTGQTKKIVKLFDEAKDKNPHDFNGVTPYHLAAKNGHLEICLMIHQHLETSFDNEINPHDHNKYTPFHYAAARGQVPICKFLIDRESKKNPKCDHDGTPLHLATANGHYEVCKIIIEKIDDKNPKTRDGLTPLHLAALWGHDKIFNLLLANVQDKNPIDREGQTPMMYYQLSQWSKKECGASQFLWHPWLKLFKIVFYSTILYHPGNSQYN